MVTNGGDVRHHPGGAAEELGSELTLMEDPRDPAEALVDASASASPVILGHRHGTGLPAQRP